MGFQQWHIFVLIHNINNMLHLYNTESSHLSTITSSHTPICHVCAVWPSLSTRCPQPASDTMEKSSRESVQGRLSSKAWREAGVLEAKSWACLEADQYNKRCKRASSRPTQPEIASRKEGNFPERALGLTRAARPFVTLMSLLSVLLRASGRKLQCSLPPSRRCWVLTAVPKWSDNEQRDVGGEWW